MTDTGVNRWLMTGRQLFTALLPVAVLLLAWQVLHALRRWESSLVAAEVEQNSIAMTSRGIVSPPVLSRHLELLARAGDLDPTNVTIPLMRGSQHLLLRNSGAALRAYGEALALEARAEIYLNIGRAHTMAKDEDAAADAFQKAVDLDHQLGRDLRVFFERRRRTGARDPN
jgi:tetratricopeptide (TPR) repeat protein